MQGSRESLRGAGKNLCPGQVSAKETHRGISCQKESYGQTESVRWYTHDTLENVVKTVVSYAHRELIAMRKEIEQFPKLENMHQQIQQPAPENMHSINPKGSSKE